jgi:hypothetical protein
MAERKFDEHLIQLGLTALKGHRVTFNIIQLVCFKYPDDPSSEMYRWNTGIPLAELLGYAPSSQPIHIDFSLVLLCCFQW